MAAKVDPEIRTQILNEVLDEIRAIPCWIAGPGKSEFDLDGMSHREFVLDRIKWMRDGDTQEHIPRRRRSTYAGPDAVVDHGGRSADDSE